MSAMSHFLLSTFFNSSARIGTPSAACRVEWMDPDSFAQTSTDATPALSLFLSVRYNSFMTSLIESKRAHLQDLCRRYAVAQLELFGSAATEAFDPARSDLDFLVEFLPGQPLGPWLRHYFEFQAELARLFGRRVDLVLASAVKNRYFQRELDRTRTVLYAA